MARLTKKRAPKRAVRNFPPYSSEGTLEYVRTFERLNHLAQADILLNGIVHKGDREEPSPPVEED